MTYWLHNDSNVRELDKEEQSCPRDPPLSTETHLGRRKTLTGNLAWCPGEAQRDGASRARPCWHLRPGRAGRQAKQLPSWAFMPVVGKFVPLLFVKLSQTCGPVIYDPPDP
ncbi:unnamed protein product [Rangifer tarandus platyrhynchus]|uniref:Uncharacterized protein n=1 Tax=Rangifer tarandus platyrhynchus TaxID=3082113 RepID=A0AC59Z2T9_RANTA